MWRGKEAGRGSRSSLAGGGTAAPTCPCLSAPRPRLHELLIPLSQHSVSAPHSSAIAPSRNQFSLRPQILSQPISQARAAAGFDRSTCHPAPFSFTSAATCYSTCFSQHKHACPSTCTAKKSYLGTRASTASEAAIFIMQATSTSTCDALVRCLAERKWKTYRDALLEAKHSFLKMKTSAYDVYVYFYPLSRRIRPTSSFSACSRRKRTFLTQRASATT